MTILVTGGAGFIGSNFVHDWFLKNNERIINVDKLSYAGNVENLASLKDNELHVFVLGDIADKVLIEEILTKYKPRAVVNFAAETHVDRSIIDPENFVLTNIVGTFELLNCIKPYWEKFFKNNGQDFRFLHISTDEVYGSLGIKTPSFTENNRYKPNSPYSASKASSDHLVRAFYKTYGLPVITTNCSNNYGPFQFREKLIPLAIHNALRRTPIPIYGTGLNVRDWLFVKDHCSALRKVLEIGKIGEVYNIGGLNEKTNIDIIHTICDVLDNLRPIGNEFSIKSYRELITYVEDRKGHDYRYSVNIEKIEKTLGWRPMETFESGIQKTVEWYISHIDSSHKKNLSLNIKRNDQ